jgi:hypothetical protein
MNGAEAIMSRRSLGPVPILVTSWWGPPPYVPLVTTW